MPLEIERKFLVDRDAWRAPSNGIRYRQGYLASSDRATVRVRVGGGCAFITIKGRPTGISRAEYEYEIPPADGDEMIDTLCTAVVEKIRYEVPGGEGLVWEVDEFLGANAPLLLAEIELDSEYQGFDRPHWLADEVTGDERYYNAYLARRPYSTW